MTPLREEEASNTKRVTRAMVVNLIGVDIVLDFGYVSMRFVQLLRESIYREVKFCLREG